MGQLSGRRVDCPVINIVVGQKEVKERNRGRRIEEEEGGWNDADIFVEKRAPLDGAWAMLSFELPKLVERRHHGQASIISFTNETKLERA